MFEWKLYVIRKQLESSVRSSDLSQKKYCYVPTLSSRMIVYKGLMLADQVRAVLRRPGRRALRFGSGAWCISATAPIRFPTWDLAQPFRYLAHNGEINTVRGNVNWMHARQSMLASEKYGDDLRKIFPVCTPDASDSAMFDNALELLGAHRAIAAAGDVDAHSRAVGGA